MSATTSITTSISTTTVRSVLAWILLAVPVAAEAVHLLDDGARGGVEIFALSQLGGWYLVWTVVRDLRATTGGTSRWGPTLVTTGVIFQAGFAAAYLVSSLVAGEPAEASFIAFLIGFVALTVGGLVWSVRLRRTPWTLARLGLAGVAVLGLGAIAAGDNVVHELALQGSYLSWVLVGLGAGQRVEASRSGVVNAWSR
jgi:hypothetical protein